MEPMMYVMAILGCGDGSAACTPVRVEAQQFRTAAECQASMPVLLARHTDLSYPVISADCRRQGAQIAAAATKRPRG